MQHTPALYALIRLHAELGGKIQENKRQAERLAADLAHVEAVIHMLEPGFNLRTIAARRRNNSNRHFKRGEAIRHVMDVLRATETPLTSAEISVEVLRSFGVQEPTRDDIREMYSAVHCSLKNHRGKTVEAVGERKNWSEFHHRMGDDQPNAPVVEHSRQKAEGERNTADDTDDGLYALQRYLGLLCEGQTVALDMLFAPDWAMLEPPGRVWHEVFDARHSLVTRRAAAFIGYCRQQANKYGIKGSRANRDRASERPDGDASRRVRAQDAVHRHDQGCGRGDGPSGR